MDFDIEGARKAGYGDDEIADFLGKQRGFDTRVARDAGYSTAEIMAHLSDSWARKALPAGVAPSNAGGGRGGLGGPTAEMLAQPKRRTLGDATAGPGAALANIRENETLRQQRLNPPDPLSVPDPAAAPSLIEQRGAPISAQAQQELTDRLAAMPQAERQALQQDARLPAWMRDAASKINPVLDASTEGAARVGMSGPTLESRRDFLIKNGARADVALNQARGEAQRRQTTQAGAQATALPESLLTPDEEAAARAQGQEVSKRGSIAARGMFAAREGMAGGTAGVMAAALRAIGDDETAAIYEKVGRAADVRATAANELQLMQERARDSGMLPSGPLSGAADYTERMTVGAANSIGQMAPGLVAGLAGQGGLGMALMVMPVFGQSYVAGREAGKAPGAAAAYAAPMAALEWVGERYGLLPAAMKALRDKAATKSIEELPAWAERAVSAMEKRGLFSKPVGAVVRTQAGEQIGEQITAAGQYLIDGTEFGLDKPISLSGFLENARDTAVQTLLATGAIQAAGYGVKGAIGGSKPAEKAPEATAGTPPAVDLVALRQQHNQLAGLLDAGKIDAGKQYSPEQIAAAAGGMAAKPQARQGAEVLDDDGTGLASDAPAIATPVDERAHAAATSPTNNRPEPTDAQKEAGNYAKGHVRVAGMDVAIENPQGSVRRGVDRDGKAWENTLQAHYGYIKGTLGNDKDHVDLFIKPGTPEDYAGPVFVIDQVHPDTGKFDEHKVVLGAATEDEARQLYQANYAKDWNGAAAVTRLPMPAFKSWVKDGAKREPLGDINARAKIDTAPAEAPQSQPASAAPGPAAAPSAGAAGAAGVPAAGALDAAQAAGLSAAPKQAKARKPGPRIEAETDTLLQALAKAGGVSREELAREFGLKPEELKATVKAGNLKGYPFRKGGMGIDRAIETLQQHGYFDGVADEDVRGQFEDAIFSELGGSPRLSTAGQMRQAEQAGAAMAQEAQALQVESEEEAQAEREAIIAAESVLSEAEIQALQDDDIPDLYAELNSSPEALMRALGFTEQEIADELAREQAAAAQAGDQQDRQAGPRAEGESPSRTGRQEGRDVAPGEAEGLTLSAQTEQDLRVRAEREREAAAADAKKQADLKRRADADAQREEFTLTGSDRPADVAAAAGQSGLFDAPAREAEKPAVNDSKPKKLSKAQQVAQEQRERLANYLKPGNVVRSYGGFDEVLEFRPAQDGKPWAVKVHEVREEDGEWVRQGKPQDARWHSTMPEDRLMRNGPLAVLKPMPGEEVPYSEPRADGRPFANAPGRGVAPAEDAAPAVEADSEAKAKALEDLNDALGDLADIFGKSAKFNITPEQEQKLLPVLTRVMDAAFRAGYYSFKDAARFVLDKIRGALGAEVADQITVEHLQGAYIGMSGRYRAQGADAPAAVVAVTSKQEIEGAQRSADTSAQEPANVPSTDPDLERNSRGTAAAAPAVEAPVRPQDRGAAGRAERAGERDRREGEGRARDAGLPADGTPADGEQSDQPVRGDTAGAQPAGRTAGVDDDPRGGGLGDRGVQPDAVTAAEAAQPVDRGAERGRKLAAQRAAERIAPRAADLDSIRETLPVLLPGQQDDVFKAEQRHAAPDGYGILFTNQPGTGKTYTGLGIIKRVQRMGSEDVLIVAPSDKVIEDWIKSGQDLGLSISQLADTKSAGRGIVITTYANLGQNLALASRDWRLVVTDESHYLMQEKDGRPTSALATLRAITLHPDGAYQRARMLHADLHSKASELADAAKAARASDDLREQARAEKLDAQARDAWAAYEQARKDVQADVAARQGSARTRVAFLSATPFAYEKTVDYAQGYLFDYGEGKSGQNLASGSGAGHGYNSGDWREQFFMQHFGYRMRYNKLTEPDAKVDRGLMQRQFNGWLKKRGALSGRMLEVEPDYDRRFILVDSAIGTRIDEALDWISEMDRAQPSGGPNGYRKLGERINKKFDYLSRRYLLEAIKASEVLPHVREHLALGRKVVVFHDYKKGGGFNPFDISRLGEDAESEEGAQGAAAHNVALDEFRSQFRDLIEFPFSTMPSPIALFKRELPDVLLFNGDISPKDRRAAVAKFQDDATGPAVILVQSAAGKEGISLHDTTGKHQRVLFNLGQPTQPTTAIQQEGRIYRTGQVTDAVIRYLNTGTNWEKWAFATTIAERASAAENLGMGELARALKDGFIAAFEESGDFRAGHEGEGQGGKARDRAANEVISEFDRARGFYWGTQKKDSRTKAKEGADYFATPEPLGLKLVQWLDLRGGEDAAEPSAGHGAIARWFPENVNRTAVEPSGTLRARLAMVFEGRILPSNFEDLHLVNKFDGIAMNPPFGSGGRTAIDHLDKATQHLREGGRVAAIIPTGPAADKKFEAWFYEQKDGKSVRPDLHLVADIKLPGVTFERAGTTVMSRIVVIDRLAKGQASPGQVSRDLTGIEDINELFDRIRDMELPARTKPQPTPEDLERQAAAKPASEYAAARDLRKQADEERAQQGAKQAQDLGMPIIEHVTGKGKTLRGVVRKDLSQAQAKQADEFTFKKDGGWFIREKNIGKLLELFPLKMSLAGRRGTRAVPYPPSTKPEDLKVAAEIQQFVDMATGKPGAHPVVALDGTDASPELRGARALARAIFGHRVVFVHQPKGRLFNAIVDTAAGNTIAIDVTTDKPVMAVLGHELLHRMRALRPELYDQLRAKLAEVMSDPKAYADRLNERRAAKGLPPLDDDILTEERIADVVGDQFTDQRFWSELAQADRSLFQRIGDAVLQFIDDVVAKITKRRPFGTDQFIRDLKAARAAVVEAMAEFSRSQGSGDPNNNGFSMSLAGRGRDQSQGRGKTAAVPVDTNAPGQIGAAKGADSGNGSTSEIRQWLKGSAFADAQGSPVVLYHGTDAEVDELNVPYGGLYLAEDPAVSHAYSWDMTGTDNFVHRVAVRAERLFDATKPDADEVLDRIEAEYDNGTDYRDPDDGEYMPLRRWVKSGYLFKLGRDVQNEVMAALEAEGFDAVRYLDASPMTGDSISVVIFDPKNVRLLSNEPSAPNSEGASRGRPSPDDRVRLSLADHTPEEQEALARAGLAGKPSVGQKLRAAYGRAMDLVRDRQALADEARQGVLDQFHGIRRALQGEVGALPIDQDPYIAARLANGGTSSVMRGLLLHGQAQWADNMQHLEKIPGTKGLLDILAPLGDDVNDFFGWMVGNRAARLMKEGRENNFTPDQIKALQGLAKGRRAEFVKIAAEYSQFKRSVLDFAEKAGIIDPVARKAWDHADYIPFYRQIDEKASFSPTGRRGLAGQSSGIRTLRGGTAALNDPLENLLMNFSRLVDASLKNNAINKTIATLEDAGSDLVEKVGYDMGGVVVPTSQVKRLLMEAGTPEEVLEAIPPEAFEGMAKMWAIQAPSDPDVVRIMRGGKPVFYRVREPLLLRALTSFVPFDFPGLDAMRAFKRLLTAMVTSTPDFMVRNFARDSVAAQAIARDGFNPAKSLQGIAKSYAEGGGFESMLFAGASFQSGHVNAADPTGTSAALRRALRAKGMNAAAIDRHLASLIDTPAKFWEKYRQVGEAIENANRDAVYTAAQQAGKSATAAAYEAKDLMDFNLRGAWPAYQLLADVLPFFNARVQGLYRLGRADPKRLAQVGLLLTAASLMLAFANDGEDWYEELPDWDKDTNWHFRIGGHHFRIPKPFEVGVIFATIPERLARSIKGLDSGKKTASRLWANVRDQLAFDVVPQMFRPALDVAMNRDTFRDSPIESPADEGKLPHARYNGRTSDTMRVLAGAAAPVSDFTGLSPKRLEFLVGGYLGTVGLYALGASDMLVRELEGKPAGPALRADDLPLVKSFYRVDPARSTVYENDLYAMRAELQQIAKTVRAYAREGDLEKQRELMAKEQKKLAAEPVVTSAAKSLGALNKARDAIIADPKMSPEEKRRRIDELQLRKNALAKKVMTTPAVIAAQ